MTKSPAMEGLKTSQCTISRETHSVNLPVKNVSQSQPGTLLRQNAECVRRVVAAVDTIDLDMVSSAVNVVDVLGVDVEVDLRVAVDADVDEVRDGDGLEGIGSGGGSGSGEAGEEGCEGELHDVCVGW